jgi:hypothetical protein
MKVTTVIYLIALYVVVNYASALVEFVKAWK